MKFKLFAAEAATGRLGAGYAAAVRACARAAQLRSGVLLLLQAEAVRVKVRARARARARARVRVRVSAAAAAAGGGAAGRTLTLTLALTLTNPNPSPNQAEALQGGRLDASAYAALRDAAAAAGELELSRRMQRQRRSVGSADAEVRA